MASNDDTHVNINILFNDKNNMLNSSDQQLTREACGSWRQCYQITEERIEIYSNTDFGEDPRIEVDICLCEGFLKQV